MTEEVELFDVSTGKTYCVSLKPEDAQRAYNDPNLLSEILRVLTNDDDDQDMVVNETSGGESPGSSASSSAILEQPIMTTENVTDIQQNEFASAGVGDEIVINHHPLLAENVPDSDENSNGSIELSSKNPTIELITGSWCQEDKTVELDEIDHKSKSSAFRWTDDAIHILIALIDENSDLVVANKKMNKGFWELIAHKMCGKGLLLTNRQCVSKWRKMINTYKNALSNGRRATSSDALFKDCSYFQAMDDLCKMKGWALELFDDPTNKEDPEPSLLSKWEVTFESLLSFFDSYKANDDIISGRMAEQKYFDLQSYLQIAGWEWAVRTSSKAPKDWYIFNYEKRDLKIPYFGHPFVLKKNILLECVHGDLYYGVTNQRKEGLDKNALKPKNDEPNCLASDESKDEEPSRKKRALKPTKKLSCPAFMKVVLVYYFPEYKIECSEPLTWRSKGRVIQQLKRDMELEKSIEMVAQYYVKMSLPNSHNHEISPPKAIVTPMAPTSMKAYVDTRLLNLEETNIKERNLKLDEIREMCSKIVKLTYTPVRRGTSVKDFEVVLDKLREGHRSMQSMFDCSTSDG